MNDVFSRPRIGLHSLHPSLPSRTWTLSVSLPHHLPPTTVRVKLECYFYVPHWNRSRALVNCVHALHAVVLQQERRSRKALVRREFRKQTKCFPHCCAIPERE